MKAKETYLKGKSVFNISLIVVGITILTVYLSGVDYNRTVTSNFYFSLGIIGFCLFIFMSYGLFKGVGLVDNFPKYRDFKSGDFISSNGDTPDFPSVDGVDDLGGIFVAIIAWIVMTIFVLFLLIFLEAIFWFSFFVILTMLYWVFFRALRMVFANSEKTKGDFGLSMVYSLRYTILFTGWIFGIVYVVEIVK